MTSLTPISVRAKNISGWTIVKRCVTCYHKGKNCRIVIVIKYLELTGVLYGRYTFRKIHFVYICRSKLLIRDINRHERNAELTRLV